MCKLSLTFHIAKHIFKHKFLEPNLSYNPYMNQIVCSMNVQKAFVNK